MKKRFIVPLVLLSPCGLLILIFGFFFVTTVIKEVSCNNGNQVVCKEIADDKAENEKRQQEEKIKIEADRKEKARKDEMEQAQKAASRTPSPMKWDKHTAKVMCSKNIKTLLNDPNSYQYDSTQILSISGDRGQYGEATVAFRARNAFGGYIRGTASCEAYNQGGEVWYRVKLNR